MEKKEQRIFCFAKNSLISGNHDKPAREEEWAKGSQLCDFCFETAKSGKLTFLLHVPRLNILALGTLSENGV